MLRLHYREKNGNESGSTLIEKIYGLGMGGVITIAASDKQPSDKPSYEALKEILPPVGDGCTEPYYSNGKGPCKYSLYIPIKCETYFLKVTETNKEILVERVKNTRSNGHSLFDSILRMS